MDEKPQEAGRLLVHSCIIHSVLKLIREPRCLQVAVQDSIHHELLAQPILLRSQIAGMHIGDTHVCSMMYTNGMSFLRSVPGDTAGMAAGVHACMPSAELQTAYARRHAACCAAGASMHLWQHAMVAMKHKAAEVDSVAVGHNDRPTHAAYVPACYALDALQNSRSIHS